MASQLGGDDQGSPLTTKFENSPWFQEFLAGMRGVAPALSLPDESPLREEILNTTETELSDGEVVNVTFQIEMFTMMVGMRQQMHELTNAVTELATTVKSLSNNARDLSTNVAASTAKITPHISTVQKESRTYAEAAATPKDTPAPKTPPKGKKRSATVGPTPPKNPKQKQKKEVKAREDAAGPANDTPPPPPPPSVVRRKTVTIARRRIYATPATPTPLPNSAKLEPQISITIAKELKKCGCSAPTNLQIQINATTGTVSLTTPPGAESIEYTNFLTPMTTALNVVLPEDSQDYMEFRRAPTDSQVVIHGLSLEATSNDAETMLSVMKESLFVGQQVNITTARFLQKDPEIRLPKKFTSVVVSVPTDEVDKITPSVLIHGRYKASALMWHSNPMKQCKKCYLYRHPKEGCKATHHTCPICAGEHRLKEHKCASLTCPKKGDRKIIADCCPVTPSKCAACGGNHPAYSVECPVKIKAEHNAKEHYDRRRAS